MQHCGQEPRHQKSESPGMESKLCLLINSHEFLGDHLTFLKSHCPINHTVILIACASHNSSDS